MPHFSQHAVIVLRVIVSWDLFQCCLQMEDIEASSLVLGVPFAMHRNHPKNIAATFYGSGANAAVELPLKQRAWNCESRGLPRWALRFQVNSYSENDPSGMQYQDWYYCRKLYSIVYLQDHKINFMLALSISEMEWAMVFASARGVQRWISSQEECKDGTIPT